MLLRLFLNVLRLVTWPVWGLVPRLRRRRSAWVSLRLHGELSMLETARAAWLRRLLSGFAPTRSSVSRIRALLKQLERDRHVTGLLLQIDGLHAGFATRSALREWLVSLRASGKRLVVYLPEGGDQGALFLASAADTVLLGPPAVLTLLGAAAGRTYVKPLLTRVGVEIDVLAQGAYKTAAEPLSKDRMGDREREQLSAIVDTFQSALSEALCHRPKIEKADIPGLFEKGMFSAQDAMAAGLCDGVMYEDEVWESLGLTKRRPPLSAARYLARVHKPLWRPLRPADHVAILRLEGAIGAGSAGRGIDQRPTTAALRALARDPSVAGVILYIDSPGGSAIASDLLHREVARLAKHKPVVAWLGNVAASGGYYIAVAASKIIAEPTTITGSIGVISIRPVLTKLFEELGLRREVVKQTEHADLNDVSRPLSEAERAALEAETEHFYRRFLQVVAEGRGKTVEAIQAIAGGRVWSGRDAHAQGLVDELGGYPEARKALDALLDARGRKVQEQAFVMAPARREVALPSPIEAAVTALSAILPELRSVRDLLGLVATRQRTLYYAIDLPENP